MIPDDHRNCRIDFCPAACFLEIDTGIEDSAFPGQFIDDSRQIEFRKKALVRCFPAETVEKGVCIVSGIESIASVARAE